MGLSEENRACAEFLKKIRRRIGMLEKDLLKFGMIKSNDPDAEYLTSTHEMATITMVDGLLEYAPYKLPLMKRVRLEGKELHFEFLPPGRRSFYLKDWSYATHDLATWTKLS